jgi:hypothetical protein
MKANKTQAIKTQGDFAMKRFPMILCLATASMISTSTMADEVKTVTATGEAPYDGKDLVAAENGAKRAARRAAVEQGVGVMLESSSIVRNYELISDEIATSARGVIINEQWGPLQDGPTGSTKKISLTAQVSKDGMSSALCTVVKANHDPKVAIVLVEKHGSKGWTADRGMIEAMFVEQFTDNCFHVVEPMIDVAAVAGNGSLTKEAVDKIVDAVDAQYIVLGSAQISEGKNITGLTSPGNGLETFPFELSLKMINVANGEVVAVFSDAGQTSGASESVALGATGSVFRKKVLPASMDAFLGKVAKSWSSELVNATKVSLTLEGANKSLTSELKALMNGRADIRVQPRNMAKGKATFDVTLDGGATALADLLQSKKLGNGKLEVTELSRGKVIVVSK